MSVASVCGDCVWRVSVCGVRIYKGIQGPKTYLLEGYKVPRDTRSVTKGPTLYPTWRHVFKTLFPTNCKNDDNTANFGKSLNLSISVWSLCVTHVCDTCKKIKKSI